jgi:integrase
VALRLKLSSQETYEQIIRIHLTPVLGSTPLRDLTRDDVKAFLANRTQAGLGPERIRLALNVLCACLNSAVEAGHLPSNPAVRLGRYTEQPDAPLETVEIFTSAELDRLLDTAERQTPDFYPLVLLLARTGLRIGEAMTLQIGDLDFTRREVWVRRTWGTGKRAHGDRAIGSPKSRRLRRVDMSQQLSDVLQGHLGLREAEAILANRSPVPWLFGDSRGPMSRNMFQWQWRRLLHRAGVRHRKAHTLRHTFASQLIQNGESLAYVRDQLGHHSIEMTVDVYTHLIPGGNKAAVDRLDSPTIRNPAATAILGQSLIAVKSEPSS